MMAIGADRGVLIETDAGLEPLAVVKPMLLMLATKEGVQLAIFGEQAIDGDAGQTGQMFAALMRWPHDLCLEKSRLRASGPSWRAKSDGWSGNSRVETAGGDHDRLRLNEPQVRHAAQH